MSATTKRVPEIDLIRAVAIISMIFIHVYEVSYPECQFDGGIRIRVADNFYGGRAFCRRVHVCNGLGRGLFHAFDAENLLKARSATVSARNCHKFF